MTMRHMNDKAILDQNLDRTYVRSKTDDQVAVTADGYLSARSMTERNQEARLLFAPLANDYDRWSSVLSFGQDARWRRKLVGAVELPPGSRVLDVAAGTGMVSQLLQERGFDVIAVDQSPQMLARAATRGITTMLARAEQLPFPDCSFDALTFTYLLRYVDDPEQCMAELARVVRPGGIVGMVEFGVPQGVWKTLWMAYTRLVLPQVGAIISPGWRRVGEFLGPSIETFHREYPADLLIKLWESAGLEDVQVEGLSVGGGLVMRGRRA